MNALPNVTLPAPGAEDREASLPHLLETRLSGLVDPPPHRPVSHEPGIFNHSVQAAIIEVAALLNRPGWSPFLVGGALRDLLITPSQTNPIFEPRDLDIVVCGADREQLHSSLARTLTLDRFTRFGGLHLTKTLPSGSSIVFDVWALDDTWGFHSLNIPPRIQNFPATTFLNIDSCAIELSPPPGKSRALFEKGFFEAIAHRVLDLNYAPNPYPFVCVAHALVLAARLDFTLAPGLAAFILHHAALGGSDALIEAQWSHYGFIRAGAGELDLWLEDIRRQSANAHPQIRLSATEEQRARLWNDYPAAGPRHAANSRQPLSA